MPPGLLGQRDRRAMAVCHEPRRCAVQVSLCTTSWQRAVAQTTQCCACLHVTVRDPFQTANHRNLQKIDQPFVELRWPGKLGPVAGKEGAAALLKAWPSNDQLEELKFAAQVDKVCHRWERTD